MAESKQELVDAADAAGVPDAGDKTIPEIREELEVRAPAELGPVIPEGETEPAPARKGRVRTGVQPIEPSDIPEAGR